MSLNLITKKGDQGATKTFNNELISKSDSSLDVLNYGTETNVLMGVVRYIETSNLQRMMQKIMGFISYVTTIGDDNYEVIISRLMKMIDNMSITPDDIEVIETLAEDVRKASNDRGIQMDGWFTYKGNLTFLASNTARKFENKFHKFMESRIKYFESGEMEQALLRMMIFINRISDILFYIGLIEDHDKENTKE